MSGYIGKRFYKDIEKRRIYERDYSRTHRKEKEILRRIRYRKVKEEIFKLLGSKCCKCGFSDVRILQIDHVNGNGNKKRKGVWTYKFYKDILNEIISGSKEYQLLCPNCNWIKAVESKVWRRKYD